jgi:hypothetical protein
MNEMQVCSVLDDYEHGIGKRTASAKVSGKTFQKIVA